jgi:membrane-associated phospholipid phosphatase
VDFRPVKKPYFSNDPKRESFWIKFLLGVSLISALILVSAWTFTRSVEFISALQQWRSAPVELLFRVFTFIGDDEFFMIFFSVLLWCVSKTLGFWGAFMLLTSATYSNLIKDITLLERPPIEGVVHPAGSYAFPSGHTLTAVTVWGYLAVRIKKRGFWIWAFAAVILIGFSRMVLGYHFLGDVLGGLAFGIPFLLFFLWVSAKFAEKGWIDKFSMPALLILSIALPVLLAAVLPGSDPPKILGYLGGASFGYILEKSKVRSLVKNAMPAQVLKTLVGLAVLFAIIIGLGGLLPSAVTHLGFIRYALGGVWVTLGAPALFVFLKLSRQEEINK